MEETKRREENPEMDPGAHTTSLQQERTLRVGTGVEGELLGNHVGVTGLSYRTTPTLPTNHKIKARSTGRGTGKQQHTLQQIFGMDFGLKIVYLEQGPGSPSDSYTLCLCRCLFGSLEVITP